MKYVNITPRSVLSTVLACSMLFDMCAPAFAQSRKTTPKKTDIKKLNYRLERQVERTDAISVRNIEQNIEIQKANLRHQQGSLSQEQLRRLGTIEKMFSPQENSSNNKSDFDLFKEAYSKQLNDAFTEEKNSLQATKKELLDKALKTANDYRKEIYEPLVNEIISSPVNQNEKINGKTAANLSKKITNDILSLSIDPQKPLKDQFTKLTKKYQRNPQELQIFNQILQQMDTDPSNRYLIREEAVKEWKKQAEKAIDQWYSANINSLNKWKNNANRKAKKVFEKDYSPKMLQAREQEVKKAVQDLWAYKDLAPISKNTFLQLAPIIAQLRTLQGKSFFTTTQINWLVNQYSKLLQNSKCGNDHQTPDACNFQLIAITGLGMLSNSQKSAHLISDFMVAKRQTIYAVPTLLTGVTALLSMKQYQVLNAFLRSSTLEEHNLSNMDFLSIENLVNMFANINGQYLGEISKYTQYPMQANPTENTATANAWEDVAQLLADNGSAEALNMLREYGVEKCYVYVDLSVTMQRTYKMQCAGIIPFLVGALTSGKSGANQYHPKELNTRPGYVADNFGTHYITPAQAQANAKKESNSIYTFNHYAEIMGLTNTAAVARYLFLQSMGDLNAESELRIDTKLFNVYKNAMRGKTAKTGYGIQAYTRNSPAYNAKRARQDRTQIFRKIGRWADIGILIWCVVDITKWSMSGIKIARAMSKASSMARKGATVAQRATMLRRLNIAPQLRTFVSIPGKVKGGMEPVVLAQLPLFTSTTVELPKFAGFVESTGSIAAKSLRFSAETGTLSVDAAEMAKQAKGTVSAERIDEFNTLATDAATQANTKFANRSSWQRFWTWNKDASYRSYLTKEFIELGQARKFTPSELNPTRYLLTEGKITVPQNISTFKVPSLLEASEGMPTLNTSALMRIMAASSGVEPTAKEVTTTQELLNAAIYDANFQFLNRNWWTRQWNFLRQNYNSKYRNLLLANIDAQFDKAGLTFTNPKLAHDITTAITLDKDLQVPSWMRQIKRFSGSESSTGKFHSMGSTLFQIEKSTDAPQALPLVFQMQRKRWMRGGISGVGSEPYQRVIITQQAKDGSFVFGFGNDLSSPVKPSQFKLTLEEIDVPALLQASQSYTGTPLQLKLTSTSGKHLLDPAFYAKRWTAFTQARADGKLFPINTLLRGKNNIYVHDIPVQIRLADDTLQTLPVTFKADSYLGLRNASAVLERGGKLIWYRDGQVIQAPKLSFGLPKNQLKPFLDITANMSPDTPLRLSGLSGVNKIQPLMWATGLSLSSASTGLIAPLENIYGDRITETDKTWISLAFPYVPSLAAPAFSPLVMKIGALRTLQIALGVSTVGLGFAAYQGFSGKIDKANPPAVWPLFVSGAAIGISSALSRSGLNLLIDSMGGGGTLLKSMAYKNIGSFALLVPPFIANFIDKDIDFSLAFPVLGTLSAASLTWVSTSRLSSEIGKVSGFMPFKSLTWSKPKSLASAVGFNIASMFKATGKETWSTVRLLWTKEVLPLVVAATAFTGFEAGAFSKAGNQMIRPHLKNKELPSWIPESNRNNYVAMLTNLSVISFPLLARLTAKPTLRLMETARAGDEYRRMLQASFALNAVGVSLLYANGFNGYGSLGMLGIGLMGLGTANMTQSFQKLSNISVKTSSYAKSLTKGMSEAERIAKEKSLVTKTMTGFPVQQLGIAIVPTIVSSYTDNQIAEGTIQKSDASHSSLWIPIASLVLCFGASASRIGLFPTRIPTGLPFLTKGIIGSYSGAVKQLQMPQTLTEPRFGVPPGFSAVPTDPIVNMGNLIPSQKEFKKIETQVSKEIESAPKNKETSKDAETSEPTKQ